MPAKSEKQAKFFRVVKAIKKGDLPKSKGGKATKVAKDMTNKQINKYTKVKENIPDVNTDFSVGTDFSANLEEIIQLALAKKTGAKPKKPSYTSTKDELPANYNPMTGKFTESFTDKYDDNPKLKGKQNKLPDALQKAIIKKKGTNEHHLKNNPDAKYVAIAAPQGWFDVWEGEPFDITGENGVLVGKFKTMKDAKDYANIKNGEQGKLPKNYLQEDANKIIALEKERERLMADMEQEAEPGGGPIADEYGAKLDRIDKALEKLKGSKKQYGVLSTAELNKLARIKR